MIDIWASFRRLPVWVQIWVVGILGPMNLASLWFLGAPYGMLIAVLAVGGMVPNIAIMARERGLSKAMALPHVAVWPFLLIAITFVVFTAEGLTAGHLLFLQVLFVVDAVSLMFDVPETRDWLKGDRAIS